MFQNDNEICSLEDKIPEAVRVNKYFTYEYLWEERSTSCRSDWKLGDWNTFISSNQLFLPLADREKEDTGTEYYKQNDLEYDRLQSLHFA